MSLKLRVVVLLLPAFAVAALVFVPALYCLPRVARLARRRGPSQSSMIFVLAGVCGLLASAAISLGEARYRIPFDGLFIALASAAYARVRWASERASDVAVPASAFKRCVLPVPGTPCRISCFFSRSRFSTRSSHVSDSSVCSPKLAES